VVVAAAEVAVRLFVTGAGGQVGRELVEWCTAQGDDVAAADHAALDVTDPGAVRDAIASARPDVVVHAAAWTAVDACESDPEKAFAVNGTATKHVVAAAADAGARVIYLSTDYVFDGTKPSPYVETDEPNPVSVYGRSKYEGETSCATDRDTIVRISWVCGRYGNNMVKTLLRLAAGDADPKFVDDQIGHPTIVGDLVPVLRMFAVEHHPGVFHATNQGAVSWYEFAREVFAAAGTDPSRVSPIATKDLDPPRPAPRPANSVLDNAAMRTLGLPLMPDHRQSLVRLVQQLTA
jgi:dTDP-4-dehydrorhamnose reductase